MLRRITVGLLALLVLASALPCAPAWARRPEPAPTATPTPVPLPPEDPAVSKIALEQALAWQLGKVDRSRYTTAFAAVITSDAISQVSSDLLPLGAIQHVVWDGPGVGQNVPPGSKTYIYQVVCAYGQVFMEFSLDPAGKLAGMLFRKTRGEIDSGP